MEIVGSVKALYPVQETHRKNRHEKLISMLTKSTKVVAANLMNHMVIETTR